MNRSVRTFVAQELIVAPIPARVGQLVCISFYDDGRAFISSHCTGADRIWKQAIVDGPSADLMLNRLKISGALLEYATAKRVTSTAKRVRRTKQVIA